MTVYERRAQAVRRGDIYYISNNRGQIGSEMKKDRPAVVVSNDMNNRHSNEITVVFLTSQPKKELATHVTVYSTGRESVALCEAPTTIDKQRTGNYLGRMSWKEMQAIDKALSVALAIDRNEEGGDMMQTDKRASPEEWKEEAIRQTTIAETYKTMYAEVLNKIFQGGKKDV